MKQPIDHIYSTLQQYTKKLPVPIVELIEVQTKDPFKVLVTTILSARTKDQTTARVAQRLFSTITTLQDLTHISHTALEQLLYPVGFYKQKAKYLKQLPGVLEEKFSGRIPKKVEDLIELPGVGRKTANLVVAVAFAKPAICVDIHVHRISNRLGYVRTTTPYETEMALRKKLPRKYWIHFNTYLVAFGQHTCTPVSPYCSRCPIKKWCAQKGVVKFR